MHNFHTKWKILSCQVSCHAWYYTVFWLKMQLLCYLFIWWGSPLVFPMWRPFILGSTHKQTRGYNHYKSECVALLKWWQCHCETSHIQQTSVWVLVILKHHHWTKKNLTQEEMCRKSEIQLLSCFAAKHQQEVWWWTNPPKGLQYKV